MQSELRAPSTVLDRLAAVIATIPESDNYSPQFASDVRRVITVALVALETVKEHPGAFPQLEDALDALDAVPRLIAQEDE